MSYFFRFLLGNEFRHDIEKGTRALMKSFKSLITQTEKQENKVCMMLHGEHKK